VIFRQTAALFLDAYRELSARKLFWMVLILSGLVVAVFGAVGLNEQGIQFGPRRWTVPSELVNTNFIAPQLFYKFVFASIGVPIWLGWIACILAIVSTASIFPDFVAGGSIDLLLSKPIGRMRLFLTKYATGLLFVVLQVAIFALACFLVIGLRGDSWVPSLFWSVPLIAAMFSYLFCVCAVLGLLTRSTIASMMLTLLFWFLVFGVHAAETGVLNFRIAKEIEVGRATAEVESARARIAKEAAAATPPEATTSPASPASAPAPAAETTPPSDADEQDSDSPPQAEAPQQTAAQRDLDRAQRKFDDASDTHRLLVAWHRGLFAAKSMLPKTAETVQLLRRKLLDDSQLALFMNDKPAPEETRSGRKLSRVERERVNDQREAAKRLQSIMDQRTTGWIVGTSLGFEALVLLFGAWRFSRRDF